MGFRDYLKIDKHNLNDEMSDMATYIYDFGLRQAKLDDEILKLELKLDIVEGKIGATKRASLRNTRNKVTETTIRDQVKIHPEVVAIKEEIIVKKRSQRLAKLKSKTLFVKKDMIENISHNIREERKAIKKFK